MTKHDIRTLTHDNDEHLTGFDLRWPHETRDFGAEAIDWLIHEEEMPKDDGLPMDVVSFMGIC